MTAKSWPSTTLAAVAAFILFAAFVPVLAAAGKSPRPSGVARPRLVVLISLDQCRADYLARFEGSFLPPRTAGGVGGFRWVQEGGAQYRDAHHVHVPTYTAPGHAVMLTGSVPALHGIVGNQWVARGADGSVRVTTSVADPAVRTIGGDADPASPRQLLVGTLGEELERATGGRAKTVSIAFKDRAAIMMAGHAADVLLWLDAQGRWVTSTWYAERLPAWAARINAGPFAARLAAQAWRPLDGAPEFQHTLAPGTPVGEALRESGLGNEFLFRAAVDAVEAEGLGRDDVPDLLMLSLSTNDYVGHRYGPDSAEVRDVTRRTDRLLAVFFGALSRRVPGGLSQVIVALTADHGVTPLPESIERLRRDPAGARRIDPASLLRAADAALDAAVGRADWIVTPETLPWLSLDRAGLAAHRADAATAETIAARAIAAVPGVHSVFTRSAIAAGAVPRTPWADAVSRSFHAQRSGDLFVVVAPDRLVSSPGETGTSHGSPWPDDAHVALLLRGPGIRPGVFDRRVGLTDLAPTLAQILGLPYPSGNVGTPLHEAIGE